MNTLENAVEVTRVSYRIRPHFYSRPTSILADFSLSVPVGCSIGVLGANGAGKTTLLKLCAGILRPDSGSVRIKNLSASDPSSRRNIGFLSEVPYVYPYLRLREWLHMMGTLSGLQKPQLTDTIDRAIERYGLTEKRDAVLNTFSKGQLQRAAFAQATLHAPDILILDEPMSGMDPFWRHRIKKMLLEMKTQGKTLIFSSHIISDILRLSDKIVFIESGSLKWEGTIAQWPEASISWHVIFRTENINALAQRVDFSYLSSYPDGSFGGNVYAGDRETLIRAAGEGMAELLSLTPEYSNLKELLP